MNRSVWLIAPLLVALVAIGCTRNNDDSTPSPTEAPQPTRSVPVQSPTNPFDLVSTVFAPTSTVAIADTPVPPTPSPTPIPAGWEPLELPEDIGLNAQVFPLPGGEILVMDADREGRVFDQYVLEPASRAVRQISDLELPIRFAPSQSPFRLHDGRLVMLGGTGFKETFIFDPVTEVWSAGPTLTIDRFPNDGAFLVGDDEIAVVGQFNTPPFDTAIEVFDASSSEVTAIHVQPDVESEARALERRAARLPGTRLLILEEKGHISDNRGFPPDVVIVDVESGTWEYLDSGPGENNDGHHPMQALPDGRVFVPAGNGIRSLIFDSTDRTWEEVSAVPYRWIVLHPPLGTLHSGESVWLSTVVFLYSVSDDDWRVVPMPDGAGLSGLASRKTVLTSDGELVALQHRGFPVRTTAWIMRNPLAHAVPADEWRGAPNPQPIPTPAPTPTPTPLVAGPDQVLFGTQLDGVTLAGSAFDGESLWINSGFGTAAKFNMDGEQTDTIQLIRRENFQMAFDGDSMWVLDITEGQILDFNLDGEEQRRIQTPLASAILYRAGSLWTYARTSDRMTRRDQDGEALYSFDLDAGLVFNISEDSIWTLNPTTDDDLLRQHSLEGELLDEWSVPWPFLDNDIQFGGGYVWIKGFSRTEIGRFDPSTGELLRFETELGEDEFARDDVTDSIGRWVFPIGLLVLENSVWVSYTRYSEPSGEPLTSEPIRRLEVFDHDGNRLGRSVLDGDERFVELRYIARLDEVWSIVTSSTQGTLIQTFLVSDFVE